LSGIPIPEKSYLDGCDRVRRRGGKRWKSKDGKRLYEWDDLHGEIEVYTSKGDHLGAMDASGKVIKDAIKGRKIDV
jgi:hypothetical protein